MTTEELAISPVQEFEDAAQGWFDRRARMIDIRFGRDELKAEIERRRAEIIVNGGDGDVVIDGKNAEIREAQILVALNQSDAYKRAQQLLREAERSLLTLEAEMEDLANEMRVARMRIDLTVSNNYREAAALGIPGGLPSMKGN